jgi:hypothetical protein
VGDSYQAIYDAVRSRIGGTDMGAAVEAAVGLQAQGLSWAIEAVKTEYVNAALAQQSPHVLMRPVISIDGDQWCALYGASLHNGVAGFGDTPALAMIDFDKNWLTKRARPAVQAAPMVKE